MAHRFANDLANASLRHFSLQAQLPPSANILSACVGGALDAVIMTETDPVLEPAAKKQRKSRAKPKPRWTPQCQRHNRRLIDLRRRLI